VILYRYDNEDFPDGKVIQSRGDHLTTLTADERKTELEVRKTLSNGEEVRKTALYTWENEAAARRLAPFSRASFLYELAVDPPDILCRFDLNFFSDAVDAKTGPDFDDAIRRFCAGESGGKSATSPRIEVLVTKATIVRKLWTRGVVLTAR